MSNKKFLKLLDEIKDENSIEGFTKHSSILFIDGLNLFFRNFATINQVNQEGAHIGGLGGFLRSLGTLINLIKPTSVYIVFDGIGSSTNRKNILPEYKSNRHIQRITNWGVFENIDEEDESKTDQIIRLIHYLKCLPVKVISMEKLEADDIIAFLSTYMSETHNSKSYIVSNDKDYLQLIDKNITVYRPTEMEFYTPRKIKEKIGLTPDNFILYKTLLGDASDKIKGVQGLGEKKLKKLFPELYEEQLTLDDIFKIAESRYKDNIIYSRLIFSRNDIERNYKIMDLKKPLVDEKEKQILIKMTKEPTIELDVDTFVEMYKNDGLSHIIKDVKYWVLNVFKLVNSFK